MPPRARTPIALSREPPGPMTMPFWLSRSRWIVAKISCRPGVAAADLVDGDRDGVRQLVAHAVQGGLAHQLGDARLDVVVGVDTVRIEHRPFRQVPDQDVRQHARPAGPATADTGTMSANSPSFDNATSCSATRCFGRGVGLGHDADDRRAQLGELGGDEAVARPDALVGRHAEADDIDLGERRPHDVVEALAEQRARAVQTGGVDEDELRVVAGEDAAHRVPRGLRLVAGDDDLAADQGVGQRRLAGVRTSDEAAEAGAERHPAILPLVRTGFGRL